MQPQLCCCLALLALDTVTQRDQLLKILSTKGDWQRIVQPNSRFRPTPDRILVHLPVILFGVFSVLSAFGLIKPADLPLVMWNDIRRPKGRARGIFIFAAAVSSALTYIHTNIPRVPRGLLGAFVVGTFSFSLYRSLWEQVEKHTWTVRMRLKADGELATAD